MSTSSKFSVTYTHTLTHPHTNGPINISPLTMRGDNKPKHLPVKSNNHFYNQRVSCHKIAHLVHLRSEINQSILIKASETEIMFYWYQKLKSCSTDIRNRNHVLLISETEIMFYWYQNQNIVLLISEPEIILLISEPEYCSTDIRSETICPTDIRTRNHLFLGYQNQKSCSDIRTRNNLYYWYQSKKSSVLLIICLLNILGSNKFTVNNSPEMWQSWHTCTNILRNTLNLF